MSNLKQFRQHFYLRDSGTQYRTWWQFLHLDGSLLALLIGLACMGFFILYSASNQSGHLVERQVFHISLAFFVMLLLAQISPFTYQRWAPWIYGVGVLLLLAVAILGHVGKGAQRWLNLGVVNFQPSEIMKVAIPMLIASYFDKATLPPNSKDIMVCAIIILFPAFLTIKQPDLGTGIILIIAGGVTLFLAGLSWRLILTAVTGILITAPILWHFLHQYQKNRVLTFLNPERDPLGAGYHIIQSKIAIGSGGFLGKGWLQGTQAHLHFLPEHTTDFIFAVSAEELGFIGCLLLLGLFFAISVRCYQIASQAQDSFTRLLAGSLTITFFLSFFINIGMVTGILPVVGVPLPLVSYGGTSMVTMLANFGILMAIQTHRKVITL